MKAKKWVLIFFLIVSIGVLIYSASYYFLKVVYENNKYSDIVSRQIKNNSIYGTALNPNTFKYKLELVKQIKPTVVALGSSRVMQFRKESFNVPFVTVGGAMAHLNEGVLFLEEMIKVHKPKYIILGLDFWWFNDNFTQQNVLRYHSNDGNTMDFNKIIKPYYFIMNNKVNLSSLQYVYNNQYISNPITSYDSLGFSAMKTSDGFRSDGSRLRSKEIFGVEEVEDVKFRNTIDRIDTGDRRFQYGVTLSSKRVKIFEDLLEISIKNNIQPIIIIPPVANTVYNYMNSDNYRFITELTEYIKNLQIPNFNYHNPSFITDNDCEFIDGFHGGDIFYQRILANIYNSKKDINFNSLINIEYINKNIKYFEGKVLTVNDNESLPDEVDFLQIGCEK